MALKQHPEAELEYGEAIRWYEDEYEGRGARFFETFELRRDVGDLFVSGDAKSATWRGARMGSPSLPTCTLPSCVPMIEPRPPQDSETRLGHEML